MAKGPCRGLVGCQCSWSSLLDTWRSDSHTRAQVQLPNGSLVKIEAGGGGGRGTSAAGQTIDVEYTEVKR